MACLTRVLQVPECLCWFNVYFPGKLGVTYELCAGIVDKDVSSAEIAKMEVLEECGYDVPVESLEVVSTYR